MIVATVRRDRSNTLEDPVTVIAAQHHSQMEWWRGLIGHWGKELAKHCTDGQSAWDQKLHALLMAYKSAAHKMTRHSPAKLMFERELRLPVDLLTGRPPGEGLLTDASSFARRLNERLWYSEGLRGGHEAWLRCKGKPR